MDTNAHHRRLKTLALARARRMGDGHGGNYMQHFGKLDHIDFEKHEAGDYRAVIEKVEVKISRLSVDFRPVGEWVVDYRPVSPFAGWFFPFEAVPGLRIYRSLKDARAELLGFLAHADGAQLWKGL